MGCSGSKSSAAQDTISKTPQPIVTVQVIEPAIPVEELGSYPQNHISTPPQQPPVSNANKSQAEGNHSALKNKVPTPSWDANQVERVCFGAGCYWGTEKYFRHDFARKHAELGMIQNGQVGFMGPIYAPENPSYREVCSGETGHVEVYDLEFAGGAAYFEALVRFFFQFHDPTTLNRQGNDKGTQYASVIYCYTDEQLEIAYRVKDELQTLIDQEKITCFKGKVVTTDIRKSTKFYPAHEEHQDYLMKNPNGYCNHRIRFKEWPTFSQ